MTPRRLHNTVARLEGSTVFVAPGGVLAEGLVAGTPLCAWRAAAAEANTAYDAWRASRDAGSYAVYRASADRADAAQDALAKRSSRT